MKRNRFFCCIIIFILLAVGCKKQPARQSASPKVNQLSSEEKFLFQAIKEENISKVRELISKVTNINVANEYGYTPLILATWKL